MTNTNTLRNVLDKLHETADDYAPPHIRSQASQHLDNVGQDLMDSIKEEASTVLPTYKPPLEQLSVILQFLTYGEMMQLAIELKETANSSFNSVENTAATLHTWALNFGKPKEQQAAPQQIPTSGTVFTAAAVLPPNEMAAPAPAATSAELKP